MNDHKAKAYDFLEGSLATHEGGINGHLQIGYDDATMNVVVSIITKHYGKEPTEKSGYGRSIACAVADLREKLLKYPEDVLKSHGWFIDASVDFGWRMENCPKCNGNGVLVNPEVPSMLPEHFAGPCKRCIGTGKLQGELVRIDEVYKDMEVRIASAQSC